MKYKLTDETKTTEYGVVLHRICALVDIQRWGVCKGDLGGWVENEYNLSQDRDAWVFSDAMVCGNARVFGNAMVDFDAMVCGGAVVCGDAQVSGDAVISDGAVVCGDAWVRDKARVIGNAWVRDKARVIGNARVSGNAVISDGAVVCDDAKISGKALVCTDAQVGGDAQVSGDAVVCGDAHIGGNATVRSSADYSVFKNTWSSFRRFTYTRSNRMWRVGCFYGTGEELIKKAYGDSDTSGRCYEATVKYVEAIESAIAKEGGEK